MSSNEKLIEKYLITQVKRRGGLTFKWSSPSQRGVPDRIILFDGGIIGFLELKSEGKKMTKLQVYWIEQLKGFGFKAGYADSKKMVDEFLKGL